MIISSANCRGLSSESFLGSKGSLIEAADNADFVAEFQKIFALSRNAIAAISPHLLVLCWAVAEHFLGNLSLNLSPSL